MSSRRQRAAEKLLERGCEPDHKFGLKLKRHTHPPRYVYECQTCGNKASVSRNRDGNSSSTIGDVINDE